jgi:hypothetical protein
MMPWRRTFLTSEQVSRAFHIDPKSAKRFYRARFGRAPSRYGNGWSAAQIAILRRVLRRNRELVSSSQVARSLNVHHSTLLKVWPNQGLKLPVCRNHIGRYRARLWSPGDVARLERWLRTRYRCVNGQLGTPVKATGRRPRREFFQALQSAKRRAQI